MAAFSVAPFRQRSVGEASRLTLRFRQCMVGTPYLRRRLSKNEVFRGHGMRMWLAEGSKRLIAGAYFGVFHRAPKHLAACFIGLRYNIRLNWHLIDIAFG